MPKNYFISGDLEYHDSFSAPKNMNPKDYLRGIIMISNDTCPWRVIFRFSNICRMVEVNGVDLSLEVEEGKLLNNYMNKYFENWDKKGFVTYKEN